MHFFHSIGVFHEVVKSIVKPTIGTPPNSKTQMTISKQILNLYKMGGLNVLHERRNYVGTLSLTFPKRYQIYSNVESTTDI